MIYLKTMNNQKQMKNRINYAVGWKFVLFILCISSSIFSQTDKSESEKKDARLSLSYINTNNDIHQLKITVKSREDRVYVGVGGVAVNFYWKEANEDNKLGTANTNEQGEAVFTINNALFDQELDVPWLFLAIIENDPLVNDNETETAIIPSQTELVLEELDSVKTVKFTIAAPDENGEVVPIEGVDCGIFIKRLFGLLPIVEYESTDEEGTITVEIPNDIHGESEGKITIYAKVDDHGDYGTLITYRDINWGIPAAIVSSQKPRELWSPGSNAPLYLVFIVSIVVIMIWSVILHLIYQVFRIRKLGIK